MTLTWDEALEGTLSGLTCLWQDLDGWHLAPPPAEPPRTSIMWAWSPRAAVQPVRLRLDGRRVYLARCPEKVAFHRVRSWGADDHKVRSAISDGSHVSTLQLEVGTDADLPPVSGGYPEPVLFVRAGQDG